MASAFPLGALARTARGGRDCAAMRAWVVALAVLAGCGGAEERPSTPPAGTFDVDGHGMFIEC